MERGFEKITWHAFKKEIGDEKEIYENIVLPSSKTSGSAAYDINLLENIRLKPGEIKKIPTGIKVFMGDNEVVFLIVRSSVGFKYNIRLCNQVGVIDADYYNNATNEGHIWLAIQNEGTETKDFKKGDSLVQALFLPILSIKGSFSDKIRVGGIGSTDKE